MPDFYKTFVAVCVFFQIATASAREFFYYSPEGKQSLELETGKIILKFDDSVSFEEKKEFLLSEPLFLPFTRKMELPRPKLSVPVLRSSVGEKEFFELLDRLETDKRVSFASFFLRYTADATLQGVWEEFNVRLKNNSDFSKLQNLALENDLEISAENKFSERVYTLKTNKNSVGNALEMANIFHETGFFEFSEPNFLLSLKKLTNDTFYGSQWSLENTGTNTSSWGGTADSDMDVDLAWTISTGSPTVRIAILDEGVDLVHPDLTGNLVAGYDATNGGSNGAPSGDDAHGTACAGMVAAVANNSLGIAGIAYSCKIVPVRIAYSDANGDWVTTYSWLSNAINWAWQTGNADVLSNSWGGGSSSSLINSAISAAISSGRGGLGSPVLFAAGNDDSAVSYPATNSDVISVAAMSMCEQRKSTTSCDGETWWGSNFGTGLDVAAPGVKIYTTDISGSSGYASGNYISNFNGTSSACPNTAGVMALILSFSPNLTQTQARAVLETTCEKVGSYTYSNVAGQPNGTWTSELGYGRVNAYSALASLSDPPEISLGASAVNQSLGLNSTALQNVQISNGSSQLSLNFSASLANVTTSVASKKNISAIFGGLPQVPKGSFAQDGIGLQQVLSAGGPDTFGYTWKDSNEPGGPAFSWTDISSTGNVAVFTAVSTYSEKDEGISQVPIGFSFDFYGNTYTSAYISSNGFVSFTSFSGGTWTNQNLPTSSVPNDLIAPFWDDLDGSSQGGVYYLTSGNEFIIQFDNWPIYSSTAGNTFQVVLSSNGTIKFQYQNITSTSNASSVGIENSNGTDGLSVVYNSTYVANNLAVLFSTPANDWVTVAPTSGSVGPNSSTNLTLSFDSNGLTTNGTYTADLVIASNDPTNPSISVPITLVVASALGQMAQVSILNSGQDLILSWNTVANATFYKIYRSSNPETGFTQVATSTSTTWTDSGAAAFAQNYYYKVSANN